MNLEHAVDIYSNFITGEISFIRRRDNSEYVLSKASDNKVIGHAAFEGIEPKISNELPWEAVDKNWNIDWDQIDIVVVWRDEGEMVVATPICNWGKAPDIKLKNHPSYIEIGDAINKQLIYSRNQREKIA